VVERDLAKVEVEGSNPFTRSNLKTPYNDMLETGVFFSLDHTPYENRDMQN
jgi:hypothetical protein